MKKLLLLAMLLSPMVMKAQNLQLHYDMGRSEYDKKPNYGFFTSTFEMFKMDSLGSTFLFVDMDYRTDRQSIQTAYWEIARDFNISKHCPLQLHVEYNGGLFIDKSFGGGINNIWLVGVNYPFQIGHSFFNTYVTYNHISGNTQGADVQWTGVWNVPFLNNKFMFSGFMDVWSTDDFNTEGNRDGKKAILLTEPQLWYHLNKTFSVGSEVEISKNFIYGTDDVEINPTLAVKWNF